MIENFKGDADELKMRLVAEPVFDLTNSALNDFYAQGFDTNSFLLMLYDEKRMPFSERIPRAAFVDFVREALGNFPVTGTFESYIFVLKSIFGPDTEINFDVPASGKLGIEINAIASSEFDFIGREFISGDYQFFNMVDEIGNTLIMTGVPGIENAYELGLLFSEIIPAGITPTLFLQFIVRSDFIADDGSDMLDDSNNQIIFYEIGG